MSSVTTVRRRSSSRNREEQQRGGGCWDETVCSGDKLMREHASRVVWWLVIVLVGVALLLDGLIMTHAHNDEVLGTGSWNRLMGPTWLQPTPRALGSLVGIAITLDVYLSYMMALKKGHLDKYVGQFLIGTVIRVALWLFFLYGLSYDGTIGSMLSLIVLGVMLVWGMMTSHATSPLHAWVSLLELVFVFFMIGWLATANVKIWPSA